MKTIYFGNDGSFDVRAMLTFGVSAKETDKAIGYFGTGFKYAIAIILRLGGKVSILSDGKEYAFTKSTEQIRGKDFDMVKMNGVDAGFTTHLGINWQPWMAFRELYCNCLDEGGEISESMPNHSTIIAVQSADIHTAYMERRKYFLEGEPDLVLPGVNIHFKPSSSVYYRGIAVQKLRNDALYTYNITNSLSLTEERIAQSEYMVDYYIKKGIQACEEPQFLYKVLCAQGDIYEAKIAYDADYHVSDQFVSTAKKLRERGKHLSDSVLKILIRKKEANSEYSELVLSPVRKKMLSRAMDFLRTISINVDDYPIKPVHSLGENVLGRAKDGIIFISEQAFDLGTKQVASTLIEEFVHLKYDVNDFDRRMQNWLFDKILSLGEELSGQPI